MPDLHLSYWQVSAVKIGMVAETAVIDAVIAGILRWSPTHVVLDPVMVATSGDRLLAPEAVEVLRRKLVPRAQRLAIVIRDACG